MANRATLYQLWIRADRNSVADQSSCYLDYMLYGLRGYNKVVTEEMEAIYRNNQELSGRMGEARLYA